MSRPLVITVLVVLAATAQAQPQRELSVVDLQQAAIRLAEAQPERVHSWQKRIRRAAWAPQLRVSGGRGTGGNQIIHGLNGLDELASTQSNSWRYEATLTWTLERLVFDPNELRVSREAQRVALHREALTTQVAQLYFARRRLVNQLATAAVEDEIDAELAIDEITAILSGLTGLELPSSQRSR